MREHFMTTKLVSSLLEVLKKEMKKKILLCVLVQCVSMCGRCVARKKNCKPRHQKVKDQLEQITVGNKMFFAS